MATNNDVEAHGCTYQWKIVNISRWWWMKRGEGMKSPTFVADALEGTKWSIELYPMGDTEIENFVSIFLNREEDCCGPNNFHVNFYFAFLGKDGSVLKEMYDDRHEFSKNENWGFFKFESREKVFVAEKEAFIPEDTLTVQCTLYTANENPNITNHLFATTIIKVKRRSFVWRIGKISTFKSGKRYKFKDCLFCFGILLNSNFDRLYIDITSFDENIKYISCKTSVIDSDGKREVCDVKKYLAGELKTGILSSMLLFPNMVMANKSQYFPNDTLSLDFELVVSFVEHVGCENNSVKLINEVQGKDMSQNPSVLIDDFRLLYMDGIFSDTEIRTSTKTFPVHKAILSIRSPVFRNMFSNDMKEKSSAHVDITAFDDDTVHRMLLYVYTNYLEVLQLESAFKLYEIADYFQILSLKSRCSTFLDDNIFSTNVCQVLDLAILHNDDDLKSSVEEYIMRERKQFFGSHEWMAFMSTHLELAADIMRRRLTKKGALKL